LRSKIFLLEAMKVKVENNKKEQAFDIFKNIFKNTVKNTVEVKAEINKVENQERQYTVNMQNMKVI